MTKTFLRRGWRKYSKLGLRRKKKQVWRRPTGRDNKMREKRRGYPAIVSIGYKQNKNLRGKIDGKEVILIKNMNDLKNLKKNETAIIANIGMKKKLEIAKKAKEDGIKILNLNLNKLLKEKKAK